MAVPPAKFSNSPTGDPTSFRSRAADVIHQSVQTPFGVCQEVFAMSTILSTFPIVPSSSGQLAALAASSSAWWSSHPAWRFVHRIVSCLVWRIVPGTRSQHEAKSMGVRHDAA